MEYEFVACAGTYIMTENPLRTYLTVTSVPVNISFMFFFFSVPVNISFMFFLFFFSFFNHIICFILVVSSLSFYIINNYECLKANVLA